MVESIISPEVNKISSSHRYEGLDIFRGLAAFGVVWLHTYLNATSQYILTNESVAWLKLRDFSLPLIVMSSFFVLTISMLRKSESKFRDFFLIRFKRLWIPLFIWTTIYCFIWAFIVPKFLEGDRFGRLPSIDIFISGYMHLWFLQFIFLGSLIVYPVLRLLRTKSESEKIRISILCFLAAVIYAIVFKFSVQSIQQTVLQLELNHSFLIFTVQSIKYVFFIPVAIGLGLLSNKINNLFKSNLFRICSSMAVLFSLITHLLLEYNSITAPAYGITVFLFALQPWKRVEFRLIYIAAAYSYGTYILHFFLCEALGLFIEGGNYSFNSFSLFSISLLFYVMSLGAALILRKLMPVDWFIPLVPIEIKRSAKKNNP